MTAVSHLQALVETDRTQTPPDQDGEVATFWEVCWSELAPSQDTGAFESFTEGAGI